MTFIGLENAKKNEKGTRLKEIQKAWGITQKELTDLMDTTAQSIGRY